MRTRRQKITFACAALVIFAILSCLLLRPTAPPDPIYNGKTLSAWVDQYLVSSSVMSGLGPRRESPQMIEAAEVINQNRTNAIPILIRKVATWDSSLSRIADKLFFSTWAIRAGITKYWQERNPGIQRGIGTYGFRILGTNAASAVPDL